MATFTAQISAQVTEGQKDQIAEVLAQDRRQAVAVTEADVIREALALGLSALTGMDPGVRVVRYARRRRGI